MIPDSNNIVDLGANLFLGISGGDVLLLYLLFLMCIAVVLILARAKASTVLVTVFGLTFLFMVLQAPVSVIFWVMLLVAVFVLVMGFRKQTTGQ